ncbi:MAG TPA: C25 family cysteine peptidase [Bacteroidota bacterium]|nr:C25 family cysteine peptidase [Bacteroidota bacterium]
MKRHYTVSAFVILYGAALFSEGSAARNAQDRYSLISQTPEGWVVEYRPEVGPTAFVSIDGTPHLLFSAAAGVGDANDHAGEPLLPVDVLTLGIPQGAVLSAELIDPVYETIPNQLVAPFPTYVLDDDEQAQTEYTKNPSVYSQNRFFPSSEIVVDRPVLLRQQWIASVRISPLAYNPGTKVLRRLVRATLRVRLQTDRAELLNVQPSPPEPDPFYEAIYRSMLLNYEQAREWRVHGDAKRSGVQDPTRDWFETGRDYYKIPIAEDGWYRVTKAQLVAAGAHPSQIDPPTMKMFFRGAQIPIVVRPDTSVEFYGQRNYGDSTYTDFFTDTSAYWLTWGGAPGLRFTPSFVDSSAPIGIASTAKVSKHFEQNNWYFQGTTIADVINVETVPGEGWAWGEPSQWFFPTAVREYSFTLDQVEPSDSSSGFQATLRVRLASTTLNYATPNHHARFWLLDSTLQPLLLGEVTFPGRSTVVYTVSFPQSYLRNGTNILRIQSLPTGTGSNPNQFYLDWFEVDYHRRLGAVNDQLNFSMPAQAGASRTTFHASGFSSPQIEVFDAATKRQITGTAITPSGSEYTIAFRDTLQTARLYVVVAAGGARPVPRVTRKVFTDIRVNPQGADYIIVTHSNFLPAAQQLAQHRQSRNGVRTAVIDVESIYDEFNYGIMNGTKIKPFLKYAYENWPVPRPSFVLFFGDACWDYHRFLASSINTNYVPSYGVPVTDNWYVSFHQDTTALPYMFAGRLPVRNLSEATATVQKVVEYDSYTLGEWNKNFLFITGGNTPSEQSSFNSYSEAMINMRVLPSPIAGSPFRAYKTTRGAIDGEYRAYLKELVRNGLVFINFIGHSGGRIWGVDIGPPAELENTDGKLPFVASTSCNVGGFGEPSSNVLAEDFVLADDRGGIAAWASSTLGFPDVGKDLTMDFLQSLRDSVRGLGQLTTLARILMLRRGWPNYIYVSTVHTNNLLGDPLSQFALPLHPDLAISSSQIVPDNPAPSTNDTLVTLRVRIANYGTVPPDSVGVTLTDVFAGQSTTLLNNVKLAPTRRVDSVTVPWRGMENVGVHTLVATLDPENRISEVNELNNIASKEVYVYANVLSVVKPIVNMVVPPGVQRLVVSSPIGVDSTGFVYEFELDTVDTFDSPALVRSGPVTPGLVTGEWNTPPLADSMVYFWRARARYPTTFGNWIESSFSTSSSVPALPTVRWRENTRKQFRRDRLQQLAATDSGVTIAATPPLNLYVRSVGTRYNQLAEYYSIIKVNDQQIRGYWFESGIGSSYLAMRLDDFTGVPDFRTFNTSAFPPDSGLAHARRMLEFINETPVGNYLAFSVIFDGATGVTESLKVALENLGSTRIRQVQPYMSYVLVVRKGVNGPGMPALEALTNDTAVVSMSIPNLYSRGRGTIATQPMFIAPSWLSFHWRAIGSPQTDARVAFVGIRPSGTVDTLRVYGRDSLDIDLSFLNVPTSGERYKHLRTVGLLATSDATMTPTLRDWWMDVVAPADLAVSARTLGGDAPSATRNIEVTVYNIGYQDSDSSSVVLSVFDRQNRARPVASVSVLPIAVGASRTVVIPLSTHNLQRRVTVQATVVPAKRAKDLVWENNTAYYTFDNIAARYRSEVRVYHDGVPLMEGDYVPASPRLMVALPPQEGEQPVATLVRLSVDDRPAGEWQSTLLAASGAEQPAFTPSLTDGYHRLTFSVLRASMYGTVDTLEHTVGVNVLRESRIVQLYNYPNPFSTETSFTFMLTGTVPPEELTLRIFTVAGRRIREIRVPSSELRIGFNRIHWDGRDEDGDEVANGYYLYQIAIKGAGTTHSEMQKLVKVR